MLPWKLKVCLLFNVVLIIIIIIIILDGRLGGGAELLSDSNRERGNLAGEASGRKAVRLGFNYQSYFYFN
jgi:hypothetical protein